MSATYEREPESYHDENGFALEETYDEAEGLSASRSPISYAERKRRWWRNGITNVMFIFAW